MTRMTAGVKRMSAPAGADILLDAAGFVSGATFAISGGAQSARRLRIETSRGGLQSLQAA
jgi:hypothetical protein